MQLGQDAQRPEVRDKSSTAMSPWYPLGILAKTSIYISDGNN